jgi:hypothetical protein
MISTHDDRALRAAVQRLDVAFWRRNVALKYLAPQFWVTLTDLSAVAATGTAEALAAAVGRSMQILGAADDFRRHLPCCAALRDVYAAYNQIVQHAGRPPAETSKDADYHAES